MISIRNISADSSLIDRIVEIENESFTCPWSKKSFEDAAVSDNISVCAAVARDNTVCGFICFMIIDSEAELLNIAVSQNFRKNGIASSLMDHMIIETLSKHVERIFLEVRESNVPARSLYEKYGFEIIGKRRRYYTKPVEDAVIMQKSINLTV